jgi:hypothetical protein
MNTKMKALSVLLALVATGCASTGGTGRKPSSDKTEATRVAAAHSYLNLAATLSQSRQIMKKEGRACSIEVYESDVLDAVSRAVSLGNHEKWVRDELASMNQIGSAVGYTLSYREAMGALDASNGPGGQEVWRSALTGTRFYAPAMGVYGSMSQFELKDRGRALWTNLDFDDQGEVVKKHAEGSWQIRNGGSTPILSIEVQGRDGKSTKADFQLVKDCPNASCGWVLSKPLSPSEEFKQEHIRYYNRVESECDA